MCVPRLPQILCGLMGSISHCNLISNLIRWLFIWWETVLCPIVRFDYKKLGGVKQNKSPMTHFRLTIIARFFPDRWIRSAILHVLVNYGVYYAWSAILNEYLCTQKLKITCSMRHCCQARLAINSNNLKEIESVGKATREKQVQK